MIYLYAIEIPETITEEEFSTLFQNVSEDRQKKIEKYYFDMDKKRSLFAEILLRYILDKHFSIRKQQLKFEKNEYGKPSLSEYKDIFFNYSHSGNWVICAVSDIEIGVDVEVIKERDMEIAKRFFTTFEYEWLQSLTKDEQDENFYKLWTLKESYIKEKGKGLNISLDSFSFQFGDTIQLMTGNEIDHNYIFFSDKIDIKHALALCYKKDKDGIQEIRKDVLSYESILLWLTEKSAMI